MSRRLFVTSRSAVVIFAVIVHLCCVCSAQNLFLSPSYHATDQYPAGVAVADLNGDGNADLITVNQPHTQGGVTGSISILLGNGDGTFQAHVDYPIGNQPGSAIVVADFNGDGKLDLATPNVLDNTISVLLGNGDGTFGLRIDYPTGSSPTYVDVGDFNQDGLIDLVTSNKGDNTVSILFGNGDGTFRPYVEYAAGVDPEGVRVGDFNNDGRKDLAVANAALSGGQSSVGILLGNGDGTFQQSIECQASSSLNSLSLGDLNRDGKLDVVATKVFGAAISIYLGNGDGTLQPPIDYAVGSEPNSVSVADFDGNGTTDLSVSNLSSDTSATVSILLGNGDGTFQAQQTYSVGSHLYPGATGDFNKDGRPDLVIPSYLGSFGNTVGVLINHAPTVQFLSFPLQNRDPISAKIVSVFDHSSDYQYCANGTVTAYDGEQGALLYGEDQKPTQPFCRLTQTNNFSYGFAQKGNKVFSINGNYVGVRGDGGATYLQYDGHPGFDFVTKDQGIGDGKIPVLAAADGTVVCTNVPVPPSCTDITTVDPCIEGPGEIKIKHPNGYFSIYLHLSSSSVTARQPVFSQQIIGVSGDTGVCGKPHLHFEIRKGKSGCANAKNCDCGWKNLNDINNCIPVDPYGYTGPPPDPYTRAPNVTLWK